MFLLSVMFRMYDTDKNGFLDQVEMDSIIDQMMTVADYMGWETNELRPVSLLQWLQMHATQFQTHLCTYLLTYLTLKIQIYYTTCIGTKLINAITGASIYFYKLVVK